MNIDQNKIQSNKWCILNNGIMRRQINIDLGRLSGVAGIRGRRPDGGVGGAAGGGSRIRRPSSLFDHHHGRFACSTSTRARARTETHPHPHPMYMYTAPHFLVYFSSYLVLLVTCLPPPTTKTNPPCFSAYPPSRQHPSKNIHIGRTNICARIRRISKQGKNSLFLGIFSQIFSSGCTLPTYHGSSRFLGLLS